MKIPWSGGEALPVQSAPKKTDVAVIGAGVAGCATALFLAKAGVSVTVLEKRELAEGAAGRSVGLFWPGLVDSPIRFEQAMGASATDQMLQLCAENEELLRQHCPVKSFGSVWAAVDNREPNELSKSAPVLSRNGVSSQSYRPHGHGFTAGMQLSAGGILNPITALHRLAQDAQTAGARIVTGCPLLSSRITPQGTVLTTPSGEITADAVVFAAGAWLPDIEPWFKEKITAVREHVQAGPLPSFVTVEALRVQYGYLQWALHDHAWGLSGCRWATPHLEVGETDDTQTSPPIQAALERFRDQRYNHTAPPSRRWSYLWAKTCDGLPIIGPMPGRATWVSCTGFMGNDWGWGLRSAQAVAQGLLHGVAKGIPDWMTTARFV